ncbi:hypothetical protein [Rhodosalinus sp. K401]|uniref:hypothetical protein n=1 Tax=Rhodosalinus sp. K401 TaxID=3239195 RepID=UPI00352464AF
MTRDSADPKGLVREAYRIEGITYEECRSIFLDWALGVPMEADPRALLAELLARHGEGAPDHPMTRVLTEGRDAAAPPRRRGGWRGRDRGGAG